MFNDDYVSENSYKGDGLPFSGYASEVKNESLKTDEYSRRTPLFPKKDGRANIVVVGVGGGGCNAVNNMVRAKIEGAHFVVMNTDKQALNMSLVRPECKIQLGDDTTKGLGAGSDPEVGKRAADESRPAIKSVLEGADLLFITAGMGGGTGTGAAPVIAEVARSMGILTVAVVTKPFNFEGVRRMQNAEMGIKNLRDFVDTLLVIPNQKLIEIFKDEKITFKRAFEIADDVLRQGVQGVSDVITNSELVNLDFADVRTILSNKGLAHMGIGYGKGETRILDAVKGAIYNPLLEVSIEGATGLIINIAGGEDLMLSEVTEACDMVRDVIDPDANIIFGSTTVPEKQDVAITIIATGFVDRRFVPAKIGGTTPIANTRSLESTLAAADNQVRREVKPEPQVPIGNGYPVRPVFGQSRPSVQSQQPQQPLQRQPDPEQDRKPSVGSSRVDVPAYNVPHFLRKLRGDRKDDNN